MTDSISVGASRRRTFAALDAGVLDAAVDAAKTAQAANSIERCSVNRCHCNSYRGHHWNAAELAIRERMAALRRQRA